MNEEQMRELEKKVSELDKRVSVMETEFKNLHSSLSLIVLKIENLPDQMVKKFEEAIRLHKAECASTAKEAAKNESAKTDGNIMRTLVTIILVLVSILGTYYGVKP